MRPIDGDALLEQMKHRRDYVGRPSDPVCLVEDAPTVELTDEAAIEHLHKTGWMQNHDREMSRPRWIPFRKREPDAEERKYHPDWVWVWDCELPGDGQDILVSTGRFVWKDEWCDEGNEGSGLTSGDEIDDGWAWIPMPEPYREDA